MGLWLDAVIVSGSKPAGQVCQLPFDITDIGNCGVPSGIENYVATFLKASASTWYFLYLLNALTVIQSDSDYQKLGSVLPTYTKRFDYPPWIGKRKILYCQMKRNVIEIGFYNRDEKCLQRGTDWGFKWSGLRLGVTA
jgi:hypothetical protein